MTSRFQFDQRHLDQLRPAALVLPRQPRPGQPQVEPGENLLILQQLTAVTAHQVGQLQQNPPFFSLFLAQQLLQAVIPFEHFGRLDVQGLPAGRFILHEAFDLSAMIRLERHHVTTVTHRNQLLLKTAGELFARQQLFQLLFDPVAGLANPIAQVTQLEGGAVEQFTPRADRIDQPSLQLA